METAQVGVYCAKRPQLWKSTGHDCRFRSYDTAAELASTASDAHASNEQSPHCVAAASINRIRQAVEQFRRLVRSCGSGQSSPVDFQ